MEKPTAVTTVTHRLVSIALDTCVDRQTVTMPRSEPTTHRWSTKHVAQPPDLAWQGVHEPRTK